MDAVNVLENVFNVASVIWILVSLAILLMLVVTYLIAVYEIKDSIHLKDNVYLSEKIVSPAGWLSMFDKVYRIKCSFMAEELFVRIEKKLNSIYKTKKTEYLKQNKKIKDEYDKYSQLRKQCNQDTEQGRNEIARLNEALQDALEERLILAKNREKDQEWLKNYAAISSEEFTKQKDQLLDQLDSLPPDEKVSTLLFIALLEKDFNNIIGNEVVC